MRASWVFCDADAEDSHFATLLRVRDPSADSGTAEEVVDCAFCERFSSKRSATINWDSGLEGVAPMSDAKRVMEERKEEMDN